MAKKKHKPKKKKLPSPQIENANLIDAGIIPHTKYNCPGCPIH